MRPISPRAGVPGEVPVGLGNWQVARSVRAARRLLGVAIWTMIAIPIQAVLLLLPGRGKIAFARMYWSVNCRLIGLHVRVIGAPAHGGRGLDPAGGGTDGGAAARSRPVVFVSNHSSWLDILALGGCLHACFVSKGDVARWAVVGTVARLGRTVFVSRQRAATVRERDDMRARLGAGDNLVLFPEGTSSDGSRVMPFRSSFFAVAEGDAPPLIQPVSVVYDRLGGLPAGRSTRPVFAWYGDMDLAPHAWRLLQWGGLRVTILLHPAVDPVGWPSRKALSLAVWRTVADGAATLRQNRPARPLAAARPGPIGAEEPAAGPREEGDLAAVPGPPPAFA